VAKQKWLQRIRRWLKRLFNLRSKPRSQILKRWYSPSCAVFWLERDTPGSLATYRITPRRGDCEYLITLDFVPDIRKLDRTLERRRPFDGKFDVLLYRFGVFQVFPNGSSKPLGIWDVDLHSGGVSYSLQELAPKRAVAQVAYALLVISSQSWSEQVLALDWLEILEIKARAELRNPRHALKAYEVYVQKSESK
jgi:hypothetical protein